MLRANLSDLFLTCRLLWFQHHSIILWKRKLMKIAVWGRQTCNISCNYPNHKTMISGRLSDAKLTARNLKEVVLLLSPGAGFGSRIDINIKEYPKTAGLLGLVPCKAMAEGGDSASTEATSCFLAVDRCCFDVWKIPKNGMLWILLKGALAGFDRSCVEDLTWASSTLRPCWGGDSSTEEDEYHDVSCSPVAGGMESPFVIRNGVRRLRRTAAVIMEEARTNRALGVLSLWGMIIWVC